MDYHLIASPSELTRLDSKKCYLLLVEDQDFEGELRHLAPVVAHALAGYGTDQSKIVWARATSKAEAIAWLKHMNELNSVRGFDAVFCDIRIPEAADPYAGLDIAGEAASYRWASAVIGYTSFSRHGELLELKRNADLRFRVETPGRSVFDEFLGKEEVKSEAKLAIAKLSRCVIPTASFVDIARGWDPPALFLGRKMWTLLRELVGLAFTSVTEWPLPKILLLGDPGAGKGMCAHTYDRLLREADLVSHGGDSLLTLETATRKAERNKIRGLRPLLHTINCASLVAEGEGGRVRLFGYNGPGNGSLHSAPGAFEVTTTYTAYSERQSRRPAGHPQKFAAWNARALYEQGGVAFLDEFAAMNLELQAAVLNALEDGEVYRQDGSRVPIGCHVIFATNATVEELKGESIGDVPVARGASVRPDLLDRIPYVLEVPALVDRIDEVPELLCSLVSARLKKLGDTAASAAGIEIADSARAILEGAISEGLISSVRQLQSIANVRIGERVITEGNLRWLIRKAHLLGKPESALLKHSTTEVSISDQGLSVVLDRPLEIGWEPGDVQNLAFQIDKALQEVWRKRRKESIEDWVEGRPSCCSTETLLRINNDPETWRFAMLRLFCDWASELVTSVPVFTYPKGERLWNGIGRRLLGSSDVRDFFRSELTEKRPIFAKLTEGMITLALDEWGPLRDAGRAAQNLALKVYPDAREVATSDLLHRVYRSGRGDRRFRAFIKRSLQVS